MSCDFIDGPAAGHSLDLRTAPHFLRVVIDHEGHVDALDDPADEIGPTEAVHVYVAEKGSWMQVFVRPGGRYESARYRYLELKPGVVIAICDREIWKKWVHEHGDETARAAGLDPYIEIPKEA